MHKASIQKLASLFHVDNENAWDQYHDVWLSDRAPNGAKRHWCLVSETDDTGAVRFYAELHLAPDPENDGFQFARMASRQMTAALLLAHMNSRV